MSTPLVPNSIIHATALSLDDYPLEPDAIESGTPKASLVELLETPAIAIGVWELTEGTATDTEEDEVFVVISGRARVAFEDGTEPLDLSPGVIGRLAAGSRTRWTVTETLRKVYITLQA